MEYQVGRVGRIIVSRFEDKEDVINNLIEIVKKENVKNAVFFLIGGLKKGRVVVGPERDELPPKPIWNDIDESHELLGIGTIFYQDEDPKVHFHGAFGKREKVKVGCLRGISATFLVIESVMIEIDGINARRELDPISGLTLLKL